MLEMNRKGNHNIKGRWLVLCIAMLLGVLPQVARTVEKNPVKVSEADRRKASYVMLEAMKMRNTDSSACHDLLRYAHNIDPTNATISFHLAASRLSMQDVNDREFVGALKLMRQFVDENPDAYYEKRYYSMASLAIDSVPEAIRVLKQLVERYPDRLELQLRLADGYMRQEDYAKAISTYEAMEQELGKDEMVSAYKIQAYQQLNDTVGALNEMRSLLATAPRNADINLAMANMQMRFGNRDSALAYISRAQEYEPENGRTYLAKAQYYQAIGDTVNYDLQTRQALVSKDLDVESKLTVLTDYARHLLQDSTAGPRTETLFGVLLQQHPQEPAIHQLYADYLSAVSDYAGAAEQMGYVVDLDPTDPDAWHRQMILYMMADNYPRAIEVGERALQLNPDSISLYRYIAPAYFQMKQYDKSLAVYDLALARVDSANTSLRSDLIGGKGDVYFELGDTARSFACYEQALEVNPSNTGILNNYAYFLSVAGRNLAKAERMSAKAVQEEPGNDTYIDTYAWVFFKRKEYQMALFYMEQAIKNSERPGAELFHHYGDILWATGDKEKAVEQWTKALEMDKDNTLLQRKVQDKTYYEK